MTLSLHKVSLISLFCLGLALRIAWIYAVPLWQQADEYPHFYYIQDLYHSQTFPVSKPAFPYYEEYQPPLYYLLGAGIYSLFPQGDKDRTKHGEAFELNWKSPHYSPRNPLARALRWLSVVLWAGTFWVGYKFLNLYSGGQKEFVFLGLSVIAFLPTYVSNSSSITNDGLAIFLSSLFLWLLCRGDSRGLRQNLILGVILGWGILTKYNCLVLVPVLPLYLFVFERDRIVRVAGQALGACLGVILPWWVFCWKSYGTILPVNPGAAQHSYLGTDFGTALFHAIRNLFWSYWATAGRVYEIHFPAWVYVGIFGGISLLAMGGLTVPLSRRSSHLHLAPDQFKLAILAVLSIMLLLIVSLYYSLFGSLFTSWGKNLYVLHLFFASLLALGWRAISGKRLWLYLLPLGLLTINLVFLFGYVIPYFHG